MIYAMVFLLSSIIVIMKWRTYAVVTNLMLLVWFALDMVGINFSGTYLVSQSWQDDGVFFLIAIVCFLLFLFKEKVGRYVIVTWLTIWLITQFLNHWLFTIVGGTGAQNIRRFFSRSLHWTESKTLYIPDIYHTVLQFSLYLRLLPPSYMYGRARIQGAHN